MWQGALRHVVSACVVLLGNLRHPKRKLRSIKHIVLGCCEGVFAQGQIYVLISFVLSAFAWKPNTGSTTDTNTEPIMRGYTTIVLNTSHHL